ncbi:unnamed protein product [Haemonchus placei]|uniref:Uncharacterized protein n=1 Tax=Haemonchus placei TaxID=6290 RepID=A0A0N4WAQ2_HAEPC|nr:unnamed protein product [Haemonchus placei]
MNDKVGQELVQMSPHKLRPPHEPILQISKHPRGDVMTHSSYMKGV